MKLKELARIKAGLLCYGVKLDAKAREAGTLRNAYLLDGGFVHAAHFAIDGVVINTCVSEEFCKQSPYEISCENNTLILKENNVFISEIEILSLPEWCAEGVDGYVIGDYLRPHSPDCISCCPRLRCMYYSDETQCKFCSLASRVKSKEFVDVLPVKTVVQMIERALKYNPEYEIALSGGTCGTDDKSAKYFSDICKLLTTNRKNKLNISVELVPPDKDEYIELLYESGATAIIMNIEIANEKQRAEICPGKATIPLKRYFDAMKKAVAVFGRGKVSSVLIAGIQPEEYIVELCRKIIPMGVVPTIIPFKPLDGCQMSGEGTVDADEVLRIATAVNELLKAENLEACNQGGCTKCGGCSLETVFKVAV